MKTNEQLQKDVQNALKFESLLKGAEIGVIVKDGVVTLTGKVDSYSKKVEAENTCKRILGVKAIVEHLDVHFGNAWNKSDGDIAQEIVNAFKWNWEVPNDKVKVKVEDGWVTLEGELVWNYQKEAAYKAIHSLMGVKGITNNLKIKSTSADTIERIDIEDALKRNWSLYNSDIDVKVDDHSVTLTGFVNSWYQKEEAARIAWNANGVWHLTNNLVIDYEMELAD